MHQQCRYPRRDERLQLRRPQEGVGGAHAASTPSPAVPVPVSVRVLPSPARCGAVRARLGGRNRGEIARDDRGGGRSCGRRNRQSGRCDSGYDENPCEREECGRGRRHAHLSHRSILSAGPQRSPCCDRSVDGVLVAAHCGALTMLSIRARAEKGLAQQVQIATAATPTASADSPPTAMSSVGIPVTVRSTIAGSRPAEAVRVGLPGL